MTKIESLKYIVTGQNLPKLLARILECHPLEKKGDNSSIIQQGSTRAVNTDHHLVPYAQF
jgi:putative component of membrane protein insertase Oxa1/YidC/SpoIIIJ protein YidD